MQTELLVKASDGKLIKPDAHAQTLAYNADGTLNYVEITVNGLVYRQTLTYTSGKVTGISEWVKQ